MIGSVLSALFVYSVLSYLLITPRITIPVSIITSILVFGLTRYYDSFRTLTDSNERQNENSMIENSHDNDVHVRNSKNENWQLSSVLFVTFFAILILISSFTNGQKFHIFINWNEIGILGIIQLGAAIMLCFFIPGYALVLVLSKKYKINRILQVLLSYLLSMLVTGLTAYISSISFDGAISESKHLFIAVYLTIMVFFLIYFLRDRITLPIKLQIKYHFCYHFVSGTIIKYLKLRASELLVFGSLLMLIIVSTYVLYGGITIGDQWYHQGRSLLFMSGSVREAVLYYREAYYPPFQSALLAALTTLSGVPLVNSYASIAFLNAIPMFAFYYFFLKWVPISMRKAGPLACTLFTLSSGFGWIYLLSSREFQHIISQHSSLETLRTMGHLDIVSTSNFVIPTAPDFSTGLIYIALPAGFVLMGMLRTRFQSGFINIFLVVTISVLGIISHYEFHIFIIIASLLPLLFKMKSRSYVYVAFLTALSIVYLIDIFIPGNFYSSLEIFGYPLLLLTGVFVMITWALYLTREYLHKILESRLILLENFKKLPHRNMRFNSMTRIVIVFLVVYVYLLGFIVLSQLSLDTTRDQSSEGSVPWYLYPMRMGVVGLLGLAFILSYLFKRFERQIFVFGIIIVISLLAGPYYSEGRFSKYVMIGVIGFASLMIYKILNRRLSNNPVRNIVIIGVIIPTSGLSIFIFIGYSSLILETQDYIDTLPRRHFPSMSEMHLFEALNGMVNADSSIYNVISFPNQYDRWKDGFMAKIPSFVGLPYDKVRQSPLILNSSTIDALYRHLNYSDARFIVVPKDIIQFENSVTQPTRFAIDHFNIFYENNDYLIMTVPHLTPPTLSPRAKVALVYDQSNDLLSTKVSDIRVPQYDNKTFNLEGKNESIAIKKDNQTQGITLFDSNKGNGVALWSKAIDTDSRLNYIETKFRITAHEENESNDIRLKWREADKDYYTKLSKNGLELFQMSKDNQDVKILSQNSEIKKDDWIWYTLKVESFDDTINVYVNNVLKIQVAKDLIANATGISNVGIATFRNNVDYGPIIIANIPDRSQMYDKSMYYNYYYPLSALALSTSTYDVFSSNDLSVFSKDVVLVPDTLKLDDSMLSKYLEYVRSGGKLIIINSDGFFNGTFNRIVSISSNESNESNAEPFTNIAGNNNQNPSIEVPGLVKKLDMKSIPDTRAIAWYWNSNNQTVAPFAIEKTFSNNGRIVLINAAGYFNTISNSPREYFHSLSNVSKLIGLDSRKVTSSKNTSLPMKGFIGDMEIQGKVTLNSSSLTILPEDSHPYILNATRIKIYNKTNDPPITFDNMSIKSLKLVGDSEVIVNVTGKLELPGMISDHNYIMVSVPNDFNMTVRQHPEKHTYVEIIDGNRSFTNPIKVYNDSKVEIYNIRAGPPLKSVPMVLKSPEMTVNGSVNIKNANFDGYLNLRGALEKGPPLNFEGKLETKFDFVDHYNEPYYDGTKNQYITYLQSLALNGSTEQHEDSFKLPGDISSKAKEGIPLTNILSSSTNIITLIVLSTVTAVGVWIIRKFYK